MKITFFGLRQAFDYFQIGGTESFVRRITNQLIDGGEEVDYIMYGSEKKEIAVSSEFKLKYFERFEDALNAIENNYQHVITIHLFPKDRLKFGFFRKKYKNTTKFHLIYFSWPDSLIKRKLMFAEARIFPYNGKLFCISRRQYNYVKKWAKNAIYLLPPVPEDYFKKPEEKPKNKKIKITFLGRIDVGKGIKEVIELFKTLKDNPKFDCAIYGIHTPEDKRASEIHNWLKQQENIKYIAVDRQNYFSQTEEMTKRVLRETDIFLQPYQKLSSSIDTPVLLLEAMASLCAVITKPFGNIPEIYGQSEFLIPPEKSLPYTFNLLKNLSLNELIKERKRIYKQIQTLNFKTSEATRRFFNALKE